MPVLAERASLLSEPSRYTHSMAIEWRKCWVCEVCGFAWLQMSESMPPQCVSGKCRSRRWTTKAKQSATPKPVELLHVEPPQADPLKPRSKPAPHAKPVTRSQVQPRYHLQTAASLPTLTGPDEIQPPPVRLDQPLMQAASPVDESAKLAQIVKTLSTPHRVGEMCPHHYANWMQCPDCRPRR